LPGPSSGPGFFMSAENWILSFAAETLGFG
jgi:hypothetical protein